MNLLEKEEDLYRRWLESYSETERMMFCKDGLCTGRCEGFEEEMKKWCHSRLRVVFVLKDTNNNPNQDYREWKFEDYADGGRPVHRSFIVLMKWLYGLNTTNETSLSNVDINREQVIEKTRKYPLAIVNMKKISGGSSVDIHDVLYYAERDKSFLKEQIRRILQPNIIVCGGGSSKILQFVETELYPDYHFEKINSFCYFCRERQLLLIDSWHPSAIVSNEDKFHRFLDSFQEFLNREKPIFKALCK